MTNQLSETARTILQLIAEGYTFKELQEDYTLEQIQDATREALELDAASDSASTGANQRIKTSLRTYEVWTTKEDNMLLEMVQNGVDISDIAAQLQRHPMTVRRRMVKLGLA